MQKHYKNKKERRVTLAVRVIPKTKITIKRVAKALDKSQGKVIDSLAERL